MGVAAHPRSGEGAAARLRGTWTRGRRGSLRTAQSGTRGPLRATRWRPPAPGSGRPSAPGARGLQAARPGSSPAASPAPGAPGSQWALGPGGARPWRDADVPCPPLPAGCPQPAAPAAPRRTGRATALYDDDAANQPRCPRLPRPPPPVCAGARR